MKKRTKLPEIRCTEDLHAQVMEHANSRGLRYSQYVLSLIRADMQGGVEQSDMGQVSHANITPVSVLLPAEMIAVMKRNKEVYRLPLSVQVRNMLAGDCGKRPPEEYEIGEIIRVNNQLVALGRNLNQLTRKANAGEAVNIPAGLLAGLQSKIDEAMREVAKLRKDLGY